MHILYLTAAPAPGHCGALQNTAIPVHHPGFAHNDCRMSERVKSPQITAPGHQFTDHGLLTARTVDNHHDDTTHTCMADTKSGLMLPAMSHDPCTSLKQDLNIVS